MTALVAIVTVLVLCFYIWTLMGVGRARAKHGIDAPTMTGPVEFESAVRVQANTLEGMVIFLPSMWLFAAYVNSVVAALLGLAWIAGRYIYMQGYIKAPKERHNGFMIQAVVTVVALLGGLIGAVVSLFTGGAAT
jgi:glutathione S-transferase